MKIAKRKKKTTSIICCQQNAIKQKLGPSTFNANVCRHARRYLHA